MKNMLLATLICTVAFTGCNQAEKKPSGQTSPPAAPVKLADLTTDIDLVCGMTLEEGGIADTASYEGKVYGFCATGCKEAFLAKPQDYLAKQ